VRGGEGMNVADRKDFGVGLRAGAWLWAVWLLGAGCVRDTGVQRERGAAALYDTVPEIAAPKESRCERFGKSDVREPCEEMRSQALTYVRKLGVGDQVCLEEGFGGTPDAGCRTRATVDDAATDRLLLQIREARPESKWFKHVGNQLWFAEGALVDLYLAERGF